MEKILEKQMIRVTETKEEVGDEKLWEHHDSNAGKYEAMRQLGVRLENA